MVRYYENNILTLLLIIAMNNINSQFEEKFIPKDGIVKITSDVTDSFYAST
ncbi:hypothetical protein KA037_03865 [Patescibacteria group bacterium]|nr:hypothetical protein [Patescibacteria group bacterium]MBP7841777.1 hypothetical protein [Patescibacteria group bacterium]